MHQLPSLRITLAELDARTAIALGDAGAAHDHVAVLRHEQCRWAELMADLAVAQLGAWHRRDDADRALAAIEARLTDAGFGLHARACEYRRAVLIGGDLGAQAIGVADAWFRSEGVVAPDRLAWMLAPWPA